MIGFAGAYKVVPKFAPRTAKVEQVYYYGSVYVATSNLRSNMHQFEKKNDYWRFNKFILFFVKNKFILFMFLPITNAVSKVLCLVINSSLRINCTCHLPNIIHFSVRYSVSNMFHYIPSKNKNMFHYTFSLFLLRGPLRWQWSAKEWKRVEVARIWKRREEVGREWVMRDGRSRRGAREKKPVSKELDTKEESHRRGALHR